MLSKFADVPGQPGTPEISDIGAESCRLTWRAPTSDGGAPITGYVIERQTEIGGRWIPLKSKAVTTEFEVRDLYEGQKYEFRVIAENKAGQGKPSESAGPIVAKSQYSM
jgi:titin